MPPPTTHDIRTTVLQVIEDMQPRDAIAAPLQQGTVLDEIERRLNIRGARDAELAVLTLWNDLFRTGYLAWGHNFANPNPPFFHTTDKGRAALRRVSRDPGNPQGYVAHLQENGRLNDIARSYLHEALECYVAGLHKASMVMLGASAESIILELRDCIEARLSGTGARIPADLKDWRIKTVADAINNIVSAQARRLPFELRARFEGTWPAFTQQIRTARNDAGHPTSIDPVTEDAVHAAFLVFPEITRTATGLLDWIPGNL